MRYQVHVLRTPLLGPPTTRAIVSLDALDVVEAALRAVARVEETIPGSAGEWWAVSAVPEHEAQQPHQTGRCDANRAQGKTTHSQRQQMPQEGHLPIPLVS